MKDERPARAKSAEPQPEPLLDPSGDSDEPAFSWLTPAADDSGAASGSSRAPGTGSAPVAGTQGTAGPA
ncbi:MAG: TIGR01906 family membrane protein, partial [Actinomycetes bacterium]